MTRKKSSPKKPTYEDVLNWNRNRTHTHIQKLKKDAEDGLISREDLGKETTWLSCIIGLNKPTKDNIDKIADILSKKHFPEIEKHQDIARKLCNLYLASTPGTETSKRKPKILATALLKVANLILWTTKGRSMYVHLTHSDLSSLPEMASTQTIATYRVAIEKAILIKYSPNFDEKTYKKSRETPSVHHYGYNSAKIADSVYIELNEIVKKHDKIVKDPCGAK